MANADTGENATMTDEDEETIDVKLRVSVVEAAQAMARAGATVATGSDPGEPDPATAITAVVRAQATELVQLRAAGEAHRASLN